MTSDIDARIEFDYGPRLVDDKTANSLATVRDAYRETAHTIARECPRTRDLALSLERLEESYNSARGAIVKACAPISPDEQLAIGQAAVYALDAARKAAEPPPLPPPPDVNAPQPTPTPNESRPTWETLQSLTVGWRKDLKDAGILDPNYGRAIDHAITDMGERDRMGRAKYGTPLQPNNGRDHLTDAYQEMLDAAVYAANDVIQLGGDLFASKPAYCPGPGGMIMLYGCTYPNPDKLDKTLAYALARFWKVLDLAVTFRMEVMDRSRRAATAS